MITTSIKPTIHALIDQLDEPTAKEVLDHIQWLLSDEEPLTPEELEQARETLAEIRRGEYVTLDEFRRSLA